MPRRAAVPMKFVIFSQKCSSPGKFNGGNTSPRYHNLGKSDKQNSYVKPNRIIVVITCLLRDCMKTEFLGTRSQTFRHSPWNIYLQSGSSLLIHFCREYLLLYLWKKTIARKQTFIFYIWRMTETWQKIIINNNNNNLSDRRCSCERCMLLVAWIDPRTRPLEKVSDSLADVGPHVSGMLQI